MKKAVVKELETIKNITPDADLIAEYRKYLDEKAKSNSVVRRAINGEINLSNEWNVIYRSLYGPLIVKALIPSYVNKERIIVNEKGQEIKISELEEVVGRFGDNFRNVVFNATSGAAGGVGFIYFAGNVINRLRSEKMMDRRLFLTFALVGGALGAGGALCPDERAIKARDNSAYFQSIISLVYKV